MCVAMKNLSMLVMVDVCCLLCNTVKMHFSGTGTHLWLCVLYHRKTHSSKIGLGYCV
jgi:hypothetical protein